MKRRQGGLFRLELRERYRETDGTFCIERRCALLHDNRDFAPLDERLGLLTA
jgi:hypothetical protein